MSGPVFAALAARPELAAHYAAFREAAHQALDPALVAMVRQAIAAVHGCADPEAAPIDEAALDAGTQACLAYARRMPFEHTAITDAEAAAVVAALGEPGYVAFSVVAALADAECRAGLVGLPELVEQG
ncbi:hypothetical protein U4960_02535 [Altererythrobacter sp. H2]|uniref:hypothetical protein n=1 Tax=Altererythrobacter sp. H2 TaxID=3108391 RepID=UPI002B4BD6C0|nr:hypothetical protein [Altererythrobacter sp. H2]WRK96229.1 hypothetical protein U4960_02535 [Altererythrobacter sp. H2]